MRSSMRTALCGILTALAVVFMLMVPLLPIMMYCCPVLAGLCIAVAAEEFGIRSSCGVYAAASVLSVLFVADKEAVTIFVLLLGVYPILKYIVRKLKVGLRAALKLLYVNIACVAYFFISVMLLGVPRESFGKIPSFMLIMANFILLMYDISIDRFIATYKLRFRNRIMKGKR